MFSSTATIPFLWLTAISCILGFGLGWLILHGRIRPIADNPIYQFVGWLHFARLRFALKRKLLMFLVLLIIIIAGAGAWFDFPNSPVVVSRKLGAEPNAIPCYVDAKHTFTGLVSDDWFALDEGSWFYLPSILRPCLMTTVTTLVALLPVLVATGRGADGARAMAIPFFGGVLVEFFSSFACRSSTAQIPSSNLKWAGL